MQRGSPPLPRRFRVTGPSGKGESDGGGFAGRFELVHQIRALVIDAFKAAFRLQGPTPMQMVLAACTPSARPFRRGKQKLLLSIRSRSESRGGASSLACSLGMWLRAVAKLLIVQPALTVSRRSWMMTRRSACLEYSPRADGHPARALTRVLSVLLQTFLLRAHCKRTSLLHVVVAAHCSPLHPRLSVSLGADVNDGRS